jgi:hypothetical protein
MLGFRRIASVAEGHARISSFNGKMKPRRKNIAARVIGVYVFVILFFSLLEP